jgi:F-box domain
LQTKLKVQTHRNFSNSTDLVDISGSKMEMQNFKIPIEVFENILSFVPRKDRKNNCRLVSKKFNDVVSLLDDSKSSVTVYRFELVS